MPPTGTSVGHGADQSFSWLHQWQPNKSCAKLLIDVLLLFSFQTGFSCQNSWVTMGEKHDLKFRVIKSLVKSAVLPDEWMFCVSSPQGKPCSIKKGYSIQRAVNILTFGFPPDYLSRVTLPQAKARPESCFCKFLFWKWIPFPPRIAAHCIWHTIFEEKISKLVFFLQQSAVEVGLDSVMRGEQVMAI